METSIKIFMSKEEAKIVEEIFDKKDKPAFTIINKFETPEPSFVKLELIFEDLSDIWYLAKEVGLYRMDKLSNKIKQNFDLK